MAREDMSLRTRLQPLERNTDDAGCPACRDRRGRIVLVTARQLPDGTLVSEEKEPQPCAHCGQVPEQLIEAVVDAQTGVSGCIHP
jgi:hypothetical protein